MRRTVTLVSIVMLISRDGDRYGRQDGRCADDLHRFREIAAGQRTAAGVYFVGG